MLGQTGCHSPLHKGAGLVLPSSQVLPCVAERLDQLIDDATPLQATMLVLRTCEQLGKGTPCARLPVPLSRQDTET